MCEPVSMGMFALQAAGQVASHNAQGQAVKARNRAKLKNFDLQNEQYLTEVMLDNNKYKNDVQVQEIEQDQVYQSMVDQWSQYDQQLDSMFADADFTLQNKIIEMYENSYAGTQTGATAARSAGKSAKKLGFQKAEILSKKMLARDETLLKKTVARQDAASKANKLFENVRFAPIHGPTPMAPELEAKPSKAGLIVGLATSALGAYGMSKVLKAPKIGGGGEPNPFDPTGGKGLGILDWKDVPSADLTGGIGSPDFWKQSPEPWGDFGFGNSPSISYSGAFNMTPVGNIQYDQLGSPEGLGAAKNIFS